MKHKKFRLGLSILAGGLSFVGAANATDLIVNGSFELPSDGSLNWAPEGHCGDWGGNVCTGGSSTCANALGWQCFSQYNFSLAYYDGPPIPASENPGQLLLRLPSHRLDRLESLHHPPEREPGSWA